MKPVPIDFAHPPRRFGWAGAALLVIGLVCMGGAARQDWQVREAREQRAEKLGSLRERARQVPEQGVSLSEQQVTAINQAVDALNLPWDTLFDTLEAPRYQNVALLALQPDREQGTLKIQAEARNPAEMIGYLRNLQKEPCFSDVILVHHEINDQDPNKPIRFTVEATWRAA